MPKRTRDQQNKHNEARRNMMKKGKKAIFAMEYLKIKYPEIHEDACNIYDFIREMYPNKHDITKTPEFVKTIQNGLVRDIILQSNRRKRNNVLQPVLEIPLLPTTPATATTTMPEAIPPQNGETQETSSQIIETVEMPPTYNTTDEEIEAIINDLRTDSDLQTIFDDFQVLETTVTAGVKTPMETTHLASQETTPLSSQIDQIIQEEFKRLGEDLPDLHDRSDELFL